MLVKLSNRVTFRPPSVGADGGFSAPDLEEPWLILRHLAAHGRAWHIRNEHSRSTAQWNAPARGCLGRILRKKRTQSANITRKSGAGETSKQVHYQNRRPRSRSGELLPISHSRPAPTLMKKFGIEGNYNYFVTILSGFFYHRIAYHTHPRADPDRCIPL